MVSMLPLVVKVDHELLKRDKALFEPGGPFLGCFLVLFIFLMGLLVFTKIVVGVPRLASLAVMAEVPEKA